MKKSKVLRLPILMLLFAMLLLGCNEEQLCCNDESRVDPAGERQYCLNHTDAVRLWIQTPNDTSWQRARLDSFIVINDEIDECTTVDCIEQKLQAGSSPDELWIRYEDEHTDAEDQLTRSGTAISDSRKAELIRCGFHHAIQVGIR